MFENKIKIKQKVSSLLVVGMILCSAVLMILSSSLSVAGLSIWTEDTDADFNMGTFDHMKIVGSGSPAELQLTNNTQRNWVDKLSTNEPEPRSAHAMASVYGTDNAVVFGGDKQGSETWIYDLSGNNWVKKTPVPNPGSRSEHAMASIWGYDKAVLFGGYSSVNDTWIYDLGDNTWTNKNPPNKPTPRYTHAMTHIDGTDKVLLFGGYDGTSRLNDTWIYDYTANQWENKNPPISPNHRYSHSMASISGDDKVILFGGWAPGANNETWEYDLSNNTWTQKTTSTGPSQRGYHAIAPINGTDKVILFGGWDGACDDETWEYDLSANNWTILSPTTKPMPSINHSMVAIYDTKSVMLFGGYLNTVPQYFNDTWLLSGSPIYSNGNYISVPYDTGASSSFKNINWTGVTSSNTTIEFQIRTAATNASLTSNNFLGPGGSGSSYYTTPGQAIWSGHLGDRWLQYRAFLSTTNSKETPSLDNVTIMFNNLPQTFLIGPSNSTAISDNTPTFSWLFSDSESEVQIEFDILIDDNINFVSVDYNNNQTTGDKFWQFPIGTGYSTLPDGTWYWKVRAKDEDNNWGGYSKPFSVSIDTTAPSSLLSAPNNNSYYNNLINITGTASDTLPGSGVNKVEIAIKQLSNNKYWNGFAWVTSPTWLIASGTSAWFYNTPSVTWTSGTQYTIFTRATDGVANLELPGTGNTFTFDSDKPLSSIQDPQSNSYLNYLESISGSALDTGGAGVNKVEVSIEQTNDNKFWSGVTWVSTETWLSASGFNAWSYDCNSVSWTPGNEYMIRSRGIDNATNLEDPGIGNNFIFDSEKPSSSIENPGNNSYQNDIVIITGTSNDPFGLGISLVEVSIQRNSDDYYWTGTNWAQIITWLTTEGDESWEFDTKDVQWTTDIYYTIRSRAKDLSGNLELPGSGIIFMYDIQPPENLVIFINNGVKYTGSTAVKLSLQGDDAGSGIDQISLSSDGKSWSEWESFSLIKSYNLSKGEGEKNIYFRMTDKAGNIANSVFTSIILDTTPPDELSVIINDNAEFTNSQMVILTLSAGDDLSGINEMSFSTDGITWTVWQAFAITEDLSLPELDGEKVVYFKASDNVGNIAEPVFNYIVLDTSPPEDLSIILNDDEKYTNSIQISFELDALDFLSGVTEMSFSSDSVKWTTWESFDKQKSFNIEGSNDGEIVVYFRVRDKVGNVAEPIFDSIVLDITPPHSLLIIIENGAIETDSAMVTLDLIAIDDLSGVNEMSFSLDGTSWSSWETYANIKSYTLSSGDGTKTIYFRTIDKAGNIAVPISEDINLKTSIIDQNKDTDADGVNDDIDAFPNDPAASMDYDDDGYPDEWNLGKEQSNSITGLQIDAFPDDPAASVDSDKDGYPDSWNPGKSAVDSTTELELDDDPNNPKIKSKDTKADKWSIDFFTIVILIIIIIIIICFSVATSTILRKKHQRSAAGKPFNEHELLWNLRQDILHSETRTGTSLADYEVDAKLEQRHKLGDISESTYQLIKNSK